jgi:hypothetical protein
MNDGLGTGASVTEVHSSEPRFSRTALQIIVRAQFQPAEKQLKVSLAEALEAAGKTDQCRHVYRCGPRTGMSFRTLRDVMANVHGAEAEQQGAQRNGCSA